MLEPLASGEILWWAAVAVVIPSVLFVERRPLAVISWAAFT